MTRPATSTPSLPNLTSSSRPEAQVDQRRKRGDEKVQETPVQVPTGQAEICVTCGPEQPDIAKLAAQKKASESQISLDFQQVKISSSTGRIDVKDLSKVRAHVMRQVHQHRRTARSANRKTAVAPVEPIIPSISSLLGAGRSDPFLRLQVPSVPKRYHELVDFCVTTLWPSPAYSREWLSIAAKNPIALHSILYSTSSHLEALRNSDLETRKKVIIEQLHHKGEAIRGCHNMIAKGQSLESDVLIQIILHLAVAETNDEEGPPDWSPFAPPFKDLQWLNIYGLRNFIIPHVIAVQDIIKQRGGIRNIRTIGLAWQISCSELVSGSETLNRPQHPLLCPLGKDIIYQPFETPNDESSTPDAVTPPGLAYLLSSGLAPEIIDVFLNLRDYSLAIERYQNRSTLPAYMNDNRNWVLHRLLSLPSTSMLLHQIDEDFRRILLVYEACCLASVMYCIHVVYPTPRSRNPRERLLPLLQEAIARVDLLKLDKPLAELVIWCVVIGGIASMGPRTVERPRFLVQLNILSTSLGLRDWVEVMAIMRRFAWVGSACDGGGERLWDEMVGSGEGIVNSDGGVDLGAAISGVGK